MTVTLEEFAKENMSAGELAAADRVRARTARKLAVLHGIAEKLDEVGFDWAAADKLFEFLNAAAPDGTEFVLAYRNVETGAILLEKPSDLASGADSKD